MEKIRILAVDDEVNMIKGMQRVISRFRLQLSNIDHPIHFDVQIAESAEQALEIMKEAPVDIMLLDQQLPGISGLELLEQLTREDTDTLIIMVTAFASLEMAVSSIRSGAFDFLAKPFTPKELRSCVAKAAEKVIMERQVRRLREEQKKVRFQFISVLGHELKAPLNAIDGYLYMVTDRVAGDDVSGYENMIGRCQTRIEDMRKLIADLLEMTKIESGERMRELSTVKLCELLEESVEMVTPDAEKRQININVSCPVGRSMMADRSEIQIILHNLISNAVKYNRDKGQVDIIVDKIDSQVVIKVSDTGIGMSDEESKKLFKEFSRIRNAKTKSISGSGLGLSTVKKICQMYGGDITVKSQPDKGSTFTVNLKEEQNQNNPE